MSADVVAIDADDAGRVADALERLGLLPDDAEERRLVVAFMLREGRDRRGWGYRLDGAELSVRPRHALREPPLRVTADHAGVDALAATAAVNATPPEI